MSHAARPLSERFESRIMHEPNSGCWLWTGAADPCGYGQIGIGGHATIRGAHRVAWELYKGEIPAGAHVLHKCDTPACVNPEHLFLGTHSGNMKDMKEKGRARNAPRFGTSNNAKLKDSDIVSIRAEPGLQRVIAAKYGVTQSVVSLIKRRLSWAHVE